MGVAWLKIPKFPLVKSRFALKSHLSVDENVGRLVGGGDAGDGQGGRRRVLLLVVVRHCYHHFPVRPSGDECESLVGGPANDGPRSGTRAPLSRWRVSAINPNAAADFNPSPLPFCARSGWLLELENAAGCSSENELPPPPTRPSRPTEAEKVQTGGKFAGRPGVFGTPQVIRRGGVFQ
jgi:hypothetical protein